MSETDKSELEERHVGFTVEPNDSGRWVVKGWRGFVEGEFPTQAEALRFALGALGRGGAPAPELRLALVGHSDG